MSDKNSSQNGIAQMVAGAVIAVAVIAGCWYFFKSDEDTKPQTIYVETSSRGVSDRTWDLIYPKK